MSLADLQWPESGSDKFDPHRARQSILARLLQLDDLPPAGSRLVEHGDPTHASPAAQVPAARCDNRPAAGGGTIGRQHPRTNSMKAPHNPHIVTPINARNRRKQLAAGVTAPGTAPGAGVRSGGRAQRTDERPTLIDIGKPDSCTSYVHVIQFLCTSYYVLV